MEVLARHDFLLWGSFQFINMKIHQSNLTESNDEMANRIMTNMIKQLASLGRHANDTIADACFE